MAKITVSDYLIKRLNELGIDEIFGLPGDYNFNIVESIERNKNVKWIGSTNELNAGYSADGYARTKGYGAIVTTFGVGELSAINAIAGCMAENVPVMKIVGVPTTEKINNKTRIHHNLVDVNYYAFKNAFDNVVEASAFLNKDNAKQEIDRLISIMVKTKKPVYLAIPMDICNLEIEDNIEDIKLISDKITLDKVTNIIIDSIVKSENPIVIADDLIKRFNAKNELNNLLSKTKIPSTNFVRGLGIIESDIKNYFGTYCGKYANNECYKYVNNSDCIIMIGAVISDLNTFNFDYKFDLDKTINIQGEYTIINGIKYENIYMKDVLTKIINKLNYVSDKKVEFGFEKHNASSETIKQLNLNDFYSKINSFLKDGDNIVAEVGMVSFGIIPMQLPKNVNIQTQTLWGSIGWGTPCSLGCAMADKQNRTILITGDGAHQLTAQEISVMMRNNVKPIIFVINNSGYTIERILCDDLDYEYNNIASWNYSMLPKVFNGECYTASARTMDELNKILDKITNEDRMCYIELIIDYLDIPELAKALVKHPEKLNMKKKSKTKQILTV